MMKVPFASVLHAVKKLLWLNVVFLVLMTLCRAAFFLSFGRGSNLDGMLGFLLKAFVLGARFDLGVIAYVNALVTLSLLLVWFIGNSGSFRVWFSAVRYYYAVMFSLVFTVLCVDLGFYSFFKDHLNILVFGIFEDDTRALFSTIFENYNIPLVVAGLVLLYAAVFFVARYFTRPAAPTPAPGKEDGSLKKKVAFAAVLVAVNFLAARGSLGMFPLGMADAEISPDTFINKLGVNGIYTLREAVEFRLNENNGYSLARDLGYGDVPEKAFTDFTGRTEGSADTPALIASLAQRTGRNPAAERLRPNVVLILMESFGSDLLRYQSPEFDLMGELKRHFDSDIVFYNFLSSGVETIAALESTLLSMPKRPMARAITQSRYAFNTFPSGAALPYRRAGYDTVFLYGGNLGWRNILSFLPRAGFDTIEGEGAMDASFPKNQWGVYDEYLFEYVYRKLAADDGKPKFIVALTTTNHPPYSLPGSYRPLPLKVSPEMEREITGDRTLAAGRFRTYQYANQKLGEFISKVKSSPYGRSTIIAVAGDHNFWNVFDYPRERSFATWAVPFYLYVPQELRPAKADTAVCGSQIDIMPTLYRLSLSEAPFVSLGRDLLDPKAPHVALNVEGFMMSGGRAARYIAGGTASWFVVDAKGRKLVETAPDEGHRTMLRYCKAALAVTDYLVKHSAEREVSSKQATASDQWSVISDK